MSVPDEAVKDLKKVKEEFDVIVESLELMADQKFMTSYTEAKAQVKKGEVVDLDDI